MNKCGGVECVARVDGVECQYMCENGCGDGKEEE